MNNKQITNLTLTVSMNDLYVHRLIVLINSLNTKLQNTGSCVVKAVKTNKKDRCIKYLKIELKLISKEIFINLLSRKLLEIDNATLSNTGTALMTNNIAILNI